MMRRALLLIVALGSSGCDIFLPDMTAVDTTKPVIQVTGGPLAFTWTLGASGNPASKFVTVANSGAGTLVAPTVIPSYTDGSGWLSVSTASTAGGYTITVQPVMSQIGAAGTYNGKVSIDCAGASNTPQAFNVTLTVAAPTTPVLVANPTSLTFSYALGSTTPSAKSVTISNGGAGSLATPTLGAVTYGTGASGWLNPSLSGGNLTVGVNTAYFGTTLSGTFTATIAVASTNATNSPLSIPVTIDVTATPTMSLSQTSLALTVPYLAPLPPIGAATPPGAVIATTITVSNSGTGALDVPTTTVEYGTSTPGWLSARVAAATSTAPYTILLYLTPQAAFLPVGNYSATVSIDSSSATNTPLTANVNLSVTTQSSPVIMAVNGSAPVTGAVFTAVSGTVSPTAQVITIVNAGGGTLAAPTVTVPSAASSWLTAAVSGAGPTYSLTLTPTGAALSTPGVYTTSLPIVSTGAVNSGILFAVRVDATVSTPRTVNVNRIGQYFPGDGTTSQNPLDDISTMSASTQGSSYAFSKSSPGYWSGTVPTGPYVLEVDFTTGNKYFFEEDASSVDVGFMVSSRQSVTASTRSTVATFHLTGLSPWSQDTDYLQISSLGARFRKFWDAGKATGGIAAGATSTNTAALDWFKDANTVSPAALNLLVAADSLTVNQFRWVDLNSTDGYYRSVAGGRLNSAAAMTDGFPATITVSLAPTSDATATYNWYLTAFENALQGAVDQLDHRTTIEAYPAMTTDANLLFNGTVGAVTELEYNPTRRGADYSFLLTYGRFLTGVVERRTVECSGTATRSYPGAASGVDYTVYLYNEENLNAGVIEPLVGPVSYVTIGGKSASLPTLMAATIGTTPVVTWVQPQLGTPSHNIVVFYELGTDASNNTTSKYIGSYYTRAVACPAPAYCLGSMKVPAAMGLTAGKYYVMEIETDAAGPSYTIASPFDRGQPYGEANFVSEVFTP